jgi:hypothetical protein
MSNNGNKGFVSEIGMIVAALQQPAFATRTLVLGGKAIKAKAVVTVLQAAVTAINAGAAARISYKGTVAKQKAAKAAAAAYVPEIRTYVAAMYGKTSEMYETFGFGAEPAKPSTATRTAAIAKGKATRAARGTLGKRQRKQIKGTVPVAAAPAPAAPAAPAGSNGSSGSNGSNGGNGNGTPSR